VKITFCNGFIAGALLAVIVAIYLFRLWQPEHQIELYTAHLLKKIEARDFARIENMVASDFVDDWGDDRERLLARLREVLRLTRNLEIAAPVPNVSVQGRDGKWWAHVQVDGDDNEVMSEIKQRVNSLSAPFELQWRRQSAKPWDWKLIRVSNRELIL
jgi:hypothetical protein